MSCARALTSSCLGTRHRRELFGFTTVVTGPSASSSNRRKQPRRVSVGDGILSLAYRWYPTFKTQTHGRGRSSLASPLQRAQVITVRQSWGPVFAVLEPLSFCACSTLSAMRGQVTARCPFRFCFFHEWVRLRPGRGARVFHSENENEAR